MKPSGLLRVPSTTKLTHALFLVALSFLSTPLAFAEGRFPQLDKQGQGGLTSEIEAMNALVGMPLFADENLWDDGDEEVANRLCLHPEGRTTLSGAFRTYPNDKARAFGSRPYSIVLNSTEGKPGDLFFVFVNKGDHGDIYRLQQGLERETIMENRKGAREYEKLLKAKLAEIPKVITAEATQIAETVGTLLGAGAPMKFGESALREKVTRWDWKGHSFLLTEQEGNYVGMRILPTTVANKGGVTERTSDDSFRALVRSRVERRPNGDVIITDIPMVNQGPKGYCVPATWERYLRYLGIPADMYLLAMAGNTGAGGGTSLTAISSAADQLVRRKGRSIEMVRTPSLGSKRLANYIENGLPIMWGMFVDHQLNEMIKARTYERSKMTDPAAWKLQIKEFRKKAKMIRTNRNSGHMCMIIGYNPDTDEIATTDSWGPEYAERWWTVEEAEAVSMGFLQAIKW